MTGTSLSHRNETFLQVIQSYYQLTKPRIIPLLLITTAAGMWLAGDGEVDPLNLFITLLGGTLAAASAQTLNCIYDKDIDYEMQRTRKRPIPSGRVQPQHALLFAMVLAGLSFGLMAWFVNVLSALLALSGIFVYMLVYTHWLKRHSTQNIVIGGAAGAIPALVGWAAVTNELSWAAWFLFAIVFFWTPPHFWALAMMICDDYAEVNVPMLPVVKGVKETAEQVFAYTVFVVPLTFGLIYPLGESGWIYGIFATVLGFVFIKKAWVLRQSPEDKLKARSLFKYSILYMMLLCTGMVIDSLPLTRHTVAFITDTLSHLTATLIG
ncbi:protoheme IX farnesyltransferase [Euhalothece natronophila Z-M001]|uniref:Protoheme IX farnesyltransferase n=1 Tax=Euhalothece natronophila Z-M001 TaxID=522448 RepID=A0A5B8NLB0_9CHRO|nr:heme o synthase [Euhalothece natronophila]QDZ39055.1 protoheme IX farnesyltransferase [Euhalothece natronophila Z-M001]